MSEKPLRGVGPTGAPPPSTANPGAPGAGVAGAGGMKPGDGRAGERAAGRDSTAPRDTRKGVTGGDQEAASPRVSLVPPARPDGVVDVNASTAETRRVVDIGRTTLMGVQSPIIERDKPTTPGRDVHLPRQLERSQGARGAARPMPATGVIPAVEMDSSAPRRLGKPDEPPHGPTDASAVAAPVVTASERTVASAAATFRAGQIGAEPRGQGSNAPLRSEGPAAGETDAKTEVDGAPNHAFAKALAIGVSLSIGLGIVVQTFIRHSLRGHASESAALIPQPSGVRAPATELPPVPAGGPAQGAGGPAAPEPARLDPSAASDIEAARRPADPTAAAGGDEPPDDTALKADRRVGPRTRTVGPPVRPPSTSRDPRAKVAPSVPQAPPGVAASDALTAPPPLTPDTVAPPPALIPPPLSAAPAPLPPPSSPPASPQPKPYDPDLPLPPTAE